MPDQITIRIAILISENSKGDEEIAKIQKYFETKAVSEAITPHQEHDLTQFDAFILPHQEKSNTSTPDIEESKQLFQKMLEQIRLEETKGKPVLAWGNAVNQLLENNFIPECNELEIKPLQEIENPYDITLLTTMTRPTAFNINLEEDVRIPATVQTKTCSLQLKQMLEEKERKSIVNKLFMNEQVFFCYCSGQGEIEDTQTTNPTKSIENIAAITNRKGTVLAIIPSLAINPEQQDNPILNSIVTSIKKE